jgi:uncharacterized membrane protein
MESCKRSLVKALSYRVAGFFVTTAVAYALTDRLDLAGAIGLADTVLKLGAFYCHERLWNRIEFGRQRSSDYEI